MEKSEQKYQNQICQKYLKCGKNARVGCKCYKGLFLCSVFFANHKVDRVTIF